MRYTNQNLTKPWVFQDRVSTFSIRSGPKTFRWKQVTARVSSILRRRRDEFVIVDAMGTNPRGVSAEDVLYAQLSTWVVSKQSVIRMRKMIYHAIIRYPNATQVEVDYKPELIDEIAKSFLSCSRTNTTDDLIPTHLMSHLLLSQSAISASHSVYRRSNGLESSNSLH